MLESRVDTDVRLQQTFGPNLEVSPNFAERTENFNLGLVKLLKMGCREFHVPPEPSMLGAFQLATSKVCLVNPHALKNATPPKPLPVGFD